MSGRLAIVVLVVALSVLDGTAAAKGPLAEVADGAHGAWVAAPGTGLVLVDLQRGRVAKVVDVGRAPVAVATDAGYAWTLDAVDGTLSRVDQGRQRVDLRARLGFEPIDVAVGSRSVWVVGQRAGRPWGAVLARVDRATLRVRGRFHLGPRPAPRLAAGHGAVWLAFYPRSRGDRIGLVSIDEETGQLRFRRRLRGLPSGLASGREGIWVLADDELRDSRLLLLDARAGTLRRKLPGPYAPGDLAAGSDLIWASSVCGTPGCNISRANVRAHDERSGRLVGGPFPTRCGPRRQSQFLSGIAAVGGDGAALAVGDGRGALSLVVMLAGRGVIRCVVVSKPNR